MIKKMFKLTRFLYNEEEVKLSLIASILTKKNIFECYYWFSELYYSKIDVCDIIWEMYLDYYALINPKFEFYISKKINEWKQTGDITPLLYIIKNLHILKHDCNVFILREIYNTPDLHQSYIYRLSNPKNHLCPLFVSIKKEYWIDICYYLKKLIKNGILFNLDSYKIYESIIDKFSLDDNTKLRENWNLRIDNRDYHYILRVICSLKLNKIIVNTKTLYVSPKMEDVNEIKLIEEESIPLTSSGNKQIYKTLEYKRQFKIDENIGAFKLARFSISNYKEENYNWEYYCSFNSLWKDRIQFYNGTINEEKKCIEFDNDESLESFYEEYGYELDEQSKEVQDYSLLDIEERNYKEWFKYINCDLIDDIVLPDNFKLK
jgi:hypothetical protein